MSEFASLHCRPLEGQAPLAPDVIERYLGQCSDWTLVDGAIQKRWHFPDFHRTMAFVNAVAGVANAEDHHPDLQVSYGHCTVRFHTHSVGGLSLNDFICAAKLDVLKP
jgi:4a-hydroxytetrahydrobiopterin dehydratase